MLARAACGALLVVVAACRFNFDLLEDEGVPPDAGGESLVIALACPPAAAPGVLYECTPTAPQPLAGEQLTWSVGPASACGWLDVAPEGGRASGTPALGDAGPCRAEIAVTSSQRGAATASWEIAVDATRVAQLDVGAWHACALSPAGAVRCWGLNSFGQLGYDDDLEVGDGTAGRSIQDMGDVPIGGRVTQISVAHHQTCALLDTGGVRCWGLGGASRLGYEHSNDIGLGGVGGSIVSNGDLQLGGRASRIAMGGTTGCALMEAGGVRCWGPWHGHGNSTPLVGAAIALAGDVPLGTGPIRDLAVGYQHVCALTQAGAVRCWGLSGGLGYDEDIDVGTGLAAHAIVDMGDVPLGGPAVQISAGVFTTCAVLATGTLRCWGWNRDGQLGHNDTLDIGNGDPGRAIVDLGDVPVGGDVARVSVGEQQTCALLVGGTVRCWGANYVGQLGYNDTLSVGDGTQDRAIVDLGDVPIGAAAADVVTTDWDTGFSCALLTTGAVRCWGNNSSGELGQDHTLTVGNGGPGGTIIDNGDVTPF